MAYVDIVRDKFFTSPSGALAATEDTLLNLGPDPAQPGSFRFSPEAKVRFAPTGSTPTDVTLAQVAIADIDGDGFHDAVAYESATNPNGYNAAVGFGDGTGPGGDNGVVSGFLGTSNYLNVLKAYSPLIGVPKIAGGAVPRDFGFAVVDINGDGLADLVRNHWQRTALDMRGRHPTGEVKFCLSNGTTWISVGDTRVGRWAPAVRAFLAPYPAR